jgi:hypothetical protein
MWPDRTRWKPQAHAENVGSRSSPLVINEHIFLTAKTFLNPSQPRPSEGLGVDERSDVIPTCEAPIRTNAAYVPARRVEIRYRMIGSRNLVWLS